MSKAKQWFETAKHFVAAKPAREVSPLGLPLDALIDLRFDAEKLNLDSRKRVLTDYAGMHISGFKGRGIDFEEVRGYQPGDDIRLMDWRVTARTGKPHTKVFHEERERPVFIVVDHSASMYFGTRVTFKSAIATEAAALIAWAGMHHHDRIGGIVFQGQKHIELRPRGGKFGVLPLLKYLSESQIPQQVTPEPDALTEALARLRRVARPGSLVFILSDFANLNEHSENHLKLLTRHNDVVSCFIYDMLEKTPPPPDRYLVTDGQQQLVMDTAHNKFCRTYAAQFDAHWQHLKTLHQQHNALLIDIATSDNVLERLQQGLGGTQCERT
ncbi:MAG: DUF58 domain-containing protein [Legionellales bacterium]|nr:DUF58 domain-containing protein [Legionellales bacterium]|tara:strand:+ start:5903 stop:6883 length:981 start_codon:yes stop_codon:yes gene_type:complete